MEARNTSGYKESADKGLWGLEERIPGLRNALEEPGGGKEVRERGRVASGGWAGRGPCHEASGWSRPPEGQSRGH